MKTFFLVPILFVNAWIANGQNAPLYLWGGGLDGSTYQQTAIYSDLSNGLLFEAPKNSAGQKLPIEFNWRGGGVPPINIHPNGNIGFNTNYQSANYVFNNTTGQVSLALISDANSSSLLRFDRYSLHGQYFSIEAGAGSNDDLRIFSTSWAAPSIAVKPDGSVGIGTANTSSGSKLTVKGGIHAEEVKVDLGVPGPDYVFDKDYPLWSLQETKAYIAQHRHLPGIPSSPEMQQNGVKLLEMNMKLLEKVEELTLHLIEQNEQIIRMQIISRNQEEEINKLKGIRK